MIRVLYYAGVRQRVGTSETQVEGFAGTLAGLLKYLEEQRGIYPVDYAKDGQAEDSDPLSLMIFMINGRHIAHIGGLDAPVSDGDTVSIFPLVGGG